MQTHTLPPSSRLADASAYLHFGRLRMMSLRAASRTALAALVRENHWTSRSPRSGQLFCWRFTFSGKTRTTQATTAPLFNRFL